MKDKTNKITSTTEVKRGKADIYDIQKFEDGTIDIQTYIIFNPDIFIGRTLRDCFEIRPNGDMIHVFPVWMKVD